MENMQQNNIYKFPEGFLWGTATASYQVEGGITNDWSTSGLDAGKAAEHYDKFEEDFNAARSLDNNAHRFSIEWARIEPEPGKWDYKEVEHYRKVLQNLKANGLKPMVTLHHFTNPVWVGEMGGWANKHVIPFFEKYVRFIVNQFKDDVELWITINEPNVYAFKAYYAGEWPPYVKNIKMTLQVLKNLIKAHVEAYRAIHDVSDNLKVSFAHNIAILHPLNRFNPIDNLLAYIFNKVFNQSFWQSILTGILNIGIPGLLGIKEPFNINLQGSLDFIAFNYYTRYFVNARGEQLTRKNADVSDIGWEIYPEGLLAALKIAGVYASKQNIPIYITENGIDDRQDKKRAKYIISHAMMVWQAIQQGINVKGYIYWTLMDNFEWAEKYGPKFGLMSIDRKIRDSAFVYKEIAGQNSISQRLIDEHGA